MSRRLLVLGVALVAVLLAAGAVVATRPGKGPAGDDTRDVAGLASARTVTPPPANATFDYQIGGAYPPAAGVGVVDRDRTDAPARGRYNVCYVNAFQTQPDEAAYWTKRHPALLLHRAGRLVTDPGWPGEYLLDTSTAAKRTALTSIIGPWIDGCRRSGYRAVEPDNLDSWTRSKGLLDRSDNLAMITLLARRAHADGLAIAQKNTPELGSLGRARAHLDFAIAEECGVYAECGRYTSVYGAHVVEVEYTDNPARYYTGACTARGGRISIILRDRDVVPRGRTAYRYRAC